MSVVFLVGSEEQLRSGTDWCVVFAETLGAPVVPMIVGSETKVLAKHAASVLEDRFARINEGKTRVVSVERESDEVFEACRGENAKLLVIVHSIDQEDWQREVFERSTCRTVWLCPTDAPPSDEAHVVGGFAKSAAMTNRLCEKLIGMLPSDWSVDALNEPGELEVDEQIQQVRDQFDEEASHPETLVLIAVESLSKEDLPYAVGRKLLDHDFGTSVALVRDGQPMMSGLMFAVRRWTDSVTPPMTRDERIALQEDLESGSQPSFEFLGLISAASMLAAFGLLQNSAAVIIGAMLVAPLMTPILGAGMAIALGNRPLFNQSGKAIGLGFVGALVSSCLFGLLVRALQSPDLSPEMATEMWARCNPTPIDFCVGMVGGMAAAYARTRAYLSSALAGAAIAAALVPPISTAGLQIAFGVWKSNDAGTPIVGPLIVVGINVLTIMTAASLVLWLRGIRVRSGELRPQDRWAIRMFVMLLALVLFALLSLT
ncbi:MAG: DUF389 domain-containing protein [Planctomycetota bacterium]